MWQLTLIMEQWRQRLWFARRAVERAEEGDGRWYWSIQARILAFLVSRYGEAEAPEPLAREPVAPDAPPTSPRKPPPGEKYYKPAEHFCAVEPGHHPPKDRCALGRIMRAIGEGNSRSRDACRWRWF